MGSVCLQTPRVCASRTWVLSVEPLSFGDMGHVAWPMKEQRLMVHRYVYLMKRCCKCCVVYRTLK